MKLKTLSLGILLTVVSTLAQAQAGAAGLSDIDCPALKTGLDGNGVLTSELQPVNGEAMLKDAASFQVNIGQASVNVVAVADHSALATAAVAPVPEPASMTLIGVGLAAILVRLSRTPR